MSVIFLLIGVSLTVAIGFLVAFIYSVKTGQYEDNYTPSVRMLFENETRQNDGVTASEETNKEI
jgi:cbb3-type cytochrome oxidase maturation protein